MRELALDPHVVVVACVAVAVVAVAAVAVAVAGVEQGPGRPLGHGCEWMGRK